MTAAGFRTRKVKVEQSLGDKLKGARTRKKISVAEVEEETRIRAKFILALESDSWDQIPSEVYGRGYLERYAEFLKLPVEQLMQQYERSRAMYCRSMASPDVDLAPPSRVQRVRFLLTPKFIIVGLVIIAAAGFAGVVVTQVQRFAASPFLSLETPAQAKTIGNSQLEIYADSFTLNGRTALGATVRVNGLPVLVLSDGSFSQSVAVQKGVNAIMVEATNPAGTKSTETLTVVVK